VLVEIRYTIDGGPSQLELPEFPDDPKVQRAPAVQQVYLAAYLPEEWTVLGVRGPWTDETSVTFIDRTWREDAPDDAAILNSLRSGIGGCNTAGDTFATDGKRYLFSALRPDAGATGALRLTTMHENAVNIGIFLIVAIVGLVLTAQPIGVRLWWLAGLVILLVLAAVFAPTLAAALLGDPLKWALMLVLAIWLVRFLAWAIPQVLAWLQSRQARAVAAAAVVATAVSASPPPAADASPPPADQSGQEGGASHG
jgi:hypothetical protein